MSDPHSERTSVSAVTRDVPRSVRWRLRAAMLALALVPTMAGIYLTTAQLDVPDPVLEGQRARRTSEVGAVLTAQQSAIEGRLRAVASDPYIPRLGGGVKDEADERAAAQLLRTLRADDGEVVSGACLVRLSDGKQTPLDPGGGGSSACADAALRQLATSSPSDIVVRQRPGGEGSSRLLVATPTRSDGRFRGVISAEIDTAALFDRARTLEGGVTTSMLVDMGASAVVSSRVGAGPADGVPPTEPEAVAPYLQGIVAQSDETERDLRSLGLASTLVPLWSNGDGTRMGLVQLWPYGGGEWPLEVRLGIMAMLTGAVLAVIVLVRYFLDPFEEMVDIQVELQELYSEARKDALADGLTGLGNHRAFQEELDRQVRRYEERGSPFSLVLMDLDDLKLVNDRDGHAAGDSMLISMADTMRQLARDHDRLYRTGGDEFAMILPGTSIDDAAMVTERILHFSKRPPSGARPSPFSSGVSGVPWFGRQRDMVYRQADAALYWAKRHGRGSVEIFEPERDPLPDALTDTAGDAVSQVITSGLLRPVFQPIVDLRSGRILGFEGLIRPDPAGPLADTARLFAAAAAAGRTVELDLACIEAVVSGARAIGPDRLLTLNLSPRTLEVKDFDPAWLLSGLVRNGISPARVIIELTEREEVNDLGRLRQVFHLLQQYGLRLAADDVGAGNAGLRLLSQIQFDIVKVDLALVHSGVHREGARAVLQSLRDLAFSQHARIIAEGVETARQLKVLRELDLGAAQGFLLGRPEASLDRTFVDVRQLESSVVIPREAHPLMAPPPAGPELGQGMEVIEPQRRSIFLPPARPVLEAEFGPA